MQKKEIGRTVFIGIINRLLQLPEIEKSESTKKAFIKERDKCLSRSHVECYERLQNIIEVLIDPATLLPVYFDVARSISDEHHILDLEKIEVTISEKTKIDDVKNFVRDNFLVNAQTLEARKKHTNRINFAPSTDLERLKRIIALVITLGPTGILGDVTDDEIIWYAGISTKLDTVEKPSEIIDNLQKKYPQLGKLRY